MTNTYFVLSKKSLMSDEEKWIENTQEERSKAIKEGFTYFSAMSFSSPLTPENQEITEASDLWIEMLSPDIVKAIDSARAVLDKMQQYFHISSVRCYINGNQSVQLCFPAKMYGCENSVKDLHRIVRAMINSLKLDYGIFANVNFYCSLNEHIYSIKNLFCVKVLNIQFEDGTYRVRLTSSTFVQEEIQKLIERIKNGESEEVTKNVSQDLNLTNMYKKASLSIKLFSSSAEMSESLEMCQFFHMCSNNIDTITDGQLKALISIVKCCGYNDFDEIKSHFDDKVDKVKIVEEAEKAKDIVFCNEIRKVYECPKDCRVNCPFELKDREQTDVQITNKSYKLLDDGVYYSESQFVKENDAVKICSYLVVDGMIRNSRGVGWGRLVTVKDPDGNIHKEKIRMSDCTGSGDAVISQLCDSGLEIENQRKKLVLNYITKNTTNIRYTETSRIGWQDGVYVLPDATYGYNQKSRYHFSQVNNKYGVKGTLEDWIEHIGKKCIGHIYPEFVCQVALSGVLLRLLNIEGGGFHFYGPSSTGKSTMMYLAGSVCGGDDDHGFVYQWNGTTNAFERIAEMHNDNTLILDEIGENNSDNLGPLMYTLFNGKRKERCNADASLKESGSWLLNCLSSGEETIEYKVLRDKSMVFKTGQEIRMLNIPVVYEGKKQIYSDKLSVKEQDELSKHLKKMSNEYYGTPLRQFLKIFNDPDKTRRYLTQAKLIIDRFVVEKFNNSSSGQVSRVAARFGLIAAAGYIAVCENILPWTVVEAFRVASYLYDIWLKVRGSLIDREVHRAIENIENYINEYGSRTFARFERQGKVNKIASGKCEAGYMEITEDNKHIYYLLPSQFKKLISGANISQVVEELNKRDMLKINSNGNIMETISIERVGKRIYPIIIN